MPTHQDGVENRDKVYYIDGQKLSPVKNHPYLGFMLSNDLRWNSHVENIVVKANKSLGFVRRNLYLSSENTKHSAYVTIVRPNLDYATAVWNPYRQEQIDSIEAVQRCAARFIKRDYNRTSSVTEMLQSVDLDLLEDKRKAHRLNLFYLVVSYLFDCTAYTLIIFYLNSILLHHFLMIHLFKPTAIMIITFIVSFQGQ